MVKGLERRPIVLVDRDNLTVEDRSVVTELRHSPRDPGVLRGRIFQIAREQRHACAIFDGECVVAVPLHFVRPLLTLSQLCGARGQHRVNVFEVHEGSVTRR
jgi:hypothetical protein